jgi:hypothetical protein
MGRAQYLKLKRGEGVTTTKTFQDIEREARRAVFLELHRTEQERIAERQTAERERLIAAVRRVKCGAKTCAGTPCKMQSEKGRRRCKFHGGRSTGLKMQAGRDRIAEAQRKRWAANQDRLNTLRLS